MTKRLYLNHVNGLRAVAIMAIVFYHLRAEYCPAGYFGVDVFLVISGFFLFRKLMEPGTSAAFHYGEYLLHKAWRIIPPWFVLTLCGCLLIFFTMVDVPANDGFRTVRDSACMIADFFIDRSGNYFNPNTQENPFLHIWYLSIICQLYIIAPLLVIPLMRCNRRRTANAILCVLALGSLAYWIMTATAGLLHSSAQHNLLDATFSRNSYYHLIPRLWEILAGYAVVFLPTLATRPKLRSTLGIVGLGGIILSFFLFSTGSPCSYPTVLCTMLAIKYGDAGVPSAILSFKPVQFLGTISFSLYLWHWLIMSVYKYCSFEQINACDEVIMVAISLVAAWCSWFFVEKRISMPTPVAATCRPWKKYAVLLCLPIVFGVSSSGKNVNKKQADALEERYYAENRLTHPDFPALSFASPHDSDAELVKGFPAESFLREPFYLGDNASIPPTYLLIGDSHAQHLNPGLDRALSRAGRRGISLNNSVLPIWGYTPSGADWGDARWNQPMANGLLAYLQAHPSIHYVIVSLYWHSRLFRCEGEDWETKAIVPKEQRIAYARKGLAETVRRITDMGKSVILIGDIPFFNFQPYVTWKRKLKLGMALPTANYVRETDFRAKNAKVSAFLNSLVKDGGAISLIDPSIPLFALSEHGCPDQYHGNFLYFDDNHLTSEGSYIVGEYIVQQLLKLDSEKHKACPSSPPDEEAR